MTVSLFSRRCLHSVLLLCVCCSSYGVASAQSDRDVASGRKTDYHDDEEDGPSPTHSAAEGVTAASEGSTLPELGLFLGARCEASCSPRLSHVFCDKITGQCECDKSFPVRLGADTGCAKPVALGAQCLYAQTCSFTDQHAECTQINHNAVCQCKAGYHEVSLSRPSRRVFCSPDQVILRGADVPTLFGVATGLIILSGLICFVLKLFSRARYSRPRHYANANLAPPILFSSETDPWSITSNYSKRGIPLAVHAAATGGRPSSRASSQRSAGSTFGSGLSRRPSSGGLASLAGGSRSGGGGGGGGGGVAVPASRAGAARAAAILLISCHITATATAKSSAPGDGGGGGGGGGGEGGAGAEAGAAASDADPDADDAQNNNNNNSNNNAEPSAESSADNNTSSSGSSSSPDNDNNNHHNSSQASSRGGKLESGSRRPSLASIHSSASSSRSMSFSARRFEREQQQREARQAQLAAQAQAALAVAAAQAQAAALEASGVGGGGPPRLGLRSDPPPAPSPSPRTPMSTDELLPSVSEVKEEETATPILSHRATCSTYQGEIGPCTSSDTPH